MAESAIIRCSPHQFYNDGMSKESKTAEICALLSLVVREMVSDQDAVSVTPISSPAGFTVIRVSVAEGSDTGKVIGKQGRTARSLRIILSSIMKEHDLDNYQLDIKGSPLDKPS